MRTVRALSAITLAALAGPATAQSVDGIIGEASGSRKVALDAMTLKAAPMSELFDASSWIGTAPSAASISGKPVLLVSWSEWYRPSHAVMRLAQRLADDNPGLVVIGVHAEEGWDEAAEFIERRKITFPTVRDEGGSIRAAYSMDQDPDAYVIDRAGQLRFADITTESIRRAIEIVLAEDADSAARAEARLADAAARAEADRRRASAIGGDVSLTNLPKIPFAPPPAEAYAMANWPQQAEPDSRSRRRGEEGPVRIDVRSFPAQGWFRGRVPDIDGKVVVIYNWHPLDRDSMDRLMYRMDDLQRRLARDVVVVGMISPANSRLSRRNDDPSANLAMNVSTIERLVGTREFEQYLVASEANSPIPQVAGQGSRRNEALIGAVAVLSTDGIVRRAEHSTEWPDIQRALDQVLRVDPGVRARRAAEDAYIRGR
ncbi:MAG: TlpA disulfide reductase family protein [Planctomycetota bacterium]